MASPKLHQRVEAREEVLRRRLIGLAAVTALLATLHFSDHVIRGQLVPDRGLDPAWNHSGWPFQPRFSPFTSSLVLVYGLLLGGIVLTLRQQAWAGYWLGTAMFSARSSPRSLRPRAQHRIPERHPQHLRQPPPRDRGGHPHLRHRRHPHRDGRPGRLGPPGLRTLVTATAVLCDRPRKTVTA